MPVQFIKATHVWFQRPLLDSGGPAVAQILCLLGAPFLPRIASVHNVNIHRLDETFAMVDSGAVKSAINLDWVLRVGFKKRGPLRFWNTKDGPGQRVVG